MTLNFRISSKLSNFCLVFPTKISKHPQNKINLSGMQEYHLSECISLTISKTSQGVNVRRNIWDTKQGCGMQNRSNADHSARQQWVKSSSRCGLKRQPALGLKRVRICPVSMPVTVRQQWAQASQAETQTALHVFSSICHLTHQPKEACFIGHRGHPRVIIWVRLALPRILSCRAMGHVSYTLAAIGQHAPHSAYQNE